MMELRERYQNDAAFRSLVDTMHAFIRVGDFTPSEVRLAAILATIQYESQNLHHIVHRECAMEASAMADHRLSEGVITAARTLQGEIDKVRRSEQ